MGLTPLEGPMMGTRCGAIDPAAVAVLVEKENLTGPQVNEIMNKKSGMLAISGISGDFRDIGNAIAEGNKRAELALNMFTYQVKKILAGYIAALEGVDAIVFTAGVGENRIDVREKVTDGLEFLGIKIDKEKNKTANGNDIDISAPEATVKTLILATNEELMIARETMALVFNK
jgi:acetate kinase